MISIEEAVRHILDHTPLISETVIPIQDAVGRILRETIVSDINSPPFDKAMVDGFAFHTDHFDPAHPELFVVGEIAAGSDEEFQVGAHQCVRIMTGAPVPADVNAVVMIEESSWWEDGGRAADQIEPRERLLKRVSKEAESTGTPVDDPSWEVVQIRPENLSPNQNIMKLGTSIREGETIFEPGRRLSASDVGLLAEVGTASVRVARVPTIAILATGDELLPSYMIPGKGQIRNSNGPLLSALIREAGCTPIELGVAPDKPERLRELIQKGLQADILLLSGGVSAGAFDFVPQVLAEVGMEAVFHKVKMKPGKPLLFGTAPRSGGDDNSAARTVVFGLPGNPVSSLVSFQKFVRTAIQKMNGWKSDGANVVTGQLTEPFENRGGRPVYWPSVVTIEQGRLMVRLLNWRGSADQRTVADANALAFFPVEPANYQAGDSIELFGYRPSD